MLPHYLWSSNLQQVINVLFDESKYLVIWFGRQCCCKVYNGRNVRLLPAHVLEDTHATRQLHRQWRSGPWRRAKRPANASSVRHHRCAAAADTFTAGHHPISYNWPDQGRCYSAARDLEELKRVLNAQEITQYRMPGMQVHCLVERLRIYVTPRASRTGQQLLWEEHFMVIGAIDLHPGSTKMRSMRLSFWDAEEHHSGST